MGATACSTTESCPREWCKRSPVFWLPRERRTNVKRKKRQHEFENAGTERKHIRFGGRGSSDDFATSQSSSHHRIIPWQVANVTLVHRLVLHAKRLHNHASPSRQPAQNHSVSVATVSRSKSGCSPASRPCAHNRGCASRAGRTRSVLAPL